MFHYLLQEVPEKTKESPGAPWQLVGLLPLFDPPRHDSAETIKRALNLGVNVKMITGNETYVSVIMLIAKFRVGYCFKLSFLLVQVTNLP